MLALPVRMLRRVAGRLVIGTLLLCAVGRGLCAAAQSGVPNLLAAPQDRPVRGASYPALSADGKMLCFCWQGDLWTVPSSGGVAIRLTVHEALDAMPRWSPDGKWIAFTSLRTGNADIFLIPATGGEARQVTFHSGNDWVNDWSADGKKILFYSQRDTRTFAMYSMDLATRALNKLTRDDEPLRFGSWSPDGKSIIYMRSGQPWWRPWYHGSVAAQVVVQDLATQQTRVPLAGNMQQMWPMYSADGNSLFYVMPYGAQTTPNLWRVPLDGGPPREVTHYATDAVRFPAIARDGSLLTYVYNGDLYTVQPNGQNPARLRIIARTDDKVNNQERQTLTAEASESELSPDGKQLALVVRGQIWLVPVTGGDAKHLTDAPTADYDICWAPDGMKLAFISDRGNQTDLYTLDVKTKAVARLTNDAEVESSPQWSPDGKWVTYAKTGAKPGLYITAATAPVVPATTSERRLAEGNGNNNFGTGITSHCWSPDSRWVAFSRMDRFQNRDVWVISAAGGTAVNVTRYPGNNFDPLFSRDGRRLLFGSDRLGPLMIYQVPLEQESDAPDDSGKPVPVADHSREVRIDFSDIHLRSKPVSLPMGNVDDYAISMDSQKVILHMANAFWIAPIAGGGMSQIAAGEPGGNIRPTPDGTRFFYLGAGGTPRSMALTGGPPSVVPFTVDVVNDRRALYQQAFDQFYRKFGAAFYDAKLNGVNWKALRDKYEPQLDGVGTPEEFANLLSEMVGEVNSSHSEISPAYRPSGPQTASLGIFFDTAYAGPGLKVSAILPKGPADKPGSRVNPGEFILSVDGTDVRMNEEFYNTLQDKAGKTVELMVNSTAVKDGAHSVKLKPIPFAEWINLDYEARVKRRRDMVDTLSDHRLAYLHIRTMDEGSLKRFERELWSDANERDGLILDIRGNGGGNTHDEILQELSRRVYGYLQPRDGGRLTQPFRAWNKPVILLIDQNSYSDAEIFAAGFRTLKLGKIVGVPTPGYVIGTYDGQLMDGTHYRLPSWGWYTSEGKNMENTGIPPDITVANTPSDIAAGRDAQLETAVATAMKDLPPVPDVSP